MSWFLIHSKGLSLVSGEGFEESFYSPGPFEVAEMARMAGKLVINMQAERPASTHDADKTTNAEPITCGF